MNLQKISEQIIKPNMVKIPRSQRPEAFTLSSKKVTLTYIGLPKHTQDDRSIAKIIESEFSRFIKIASTSQCEVIIEKNIPVENISSESKTRKKYGPAGAVAWLAKQKNVPCSYYEPSPAADLLPRIAMHRIHKDDLALAIIFNVVHQTTARENLSVSAFNELAHKTCSTINIVFRKYLGYKKEITIPILATRLLTITKTKLFDLPNHGKLTKNIRQEISALQNPFSLKTPINRVAMLTNWERDRFLFEKYAKLLQKGISLFIVYDIDHLISQKPALENLLGKI